MPSEISEGDETSTPQRIVLLPKELQRGTKIRLDHVVLPKTDHSFLVGVGYRERKPDGWLSGKYLRMDTGKISRTSNGELRPGVFLDYPEGASSYIRRRIKSLSAGITQAVARFYP